MFCISIYLDQTKKFSIFSFLHKYFSVYTKLNLSRVIYDIFVSVPTEKIESSEEGCYFELASEEKKFTARKATLWLYILPDATRLVPSVAHISLIHFEKAENGSHIPVKGQTTPITIKSDKSHWLKVEITDSVNTMLTNNNMIKLMRVIPEKDAQDIQLTINEEQLAFVSFFSLKHISQETNQYF